MNQAPKKCIVCGLEGKPLVWNDMDILSCLNCGLAWRAVFDIPADYYADLHAGEVGVGEEKVTTRLHNAEDRLVSVKKFLPRSGVCDIGCGDGSFLSALRDAGYTECWGIEPSAYACALASEKKLDVVQGNISDLPQAKQGRVLNACTLFHVIEHLPDPLEMMQVLQDVLPLEGVLVIETPDADAAIQKATNHRNALVYHEHLFYWARKSLCMFLEQKGFKVLKISRRSFDWQRASITSSLTRLGWPHRAPDKHISPPSSTPLGAALSVRSSTSLLRAWARTTLANLVHMLGRDDYLLVVAERL